MAEEAPEQDVPVPLRRARAIGEERRTWCKAQDSYTLRFEHDLNPKVTLRNQTRYNNTHREAIVTALGAFVPADETVTLLRQANDRENQITSNQLSAVARLGGARFSHAVSGGFELMVGRAVCADTGRARHTRSDQHLYAQP